jgi:ABC-type transport system involved in multi-copper enzyme maturation permease subunit
MVKLGWFSAVVLMEVVALSDGGWRGGFDDFLHIQSIGTLILLVGMGFSAAGSFRHEREDGTLELLLICPFSTSRLIWGRLRGLWAQFLPSISLFAIFVLLIGRYAMYLDLDGELITCFVGWFLTVPVVGLWFSLRRWSLLASGLITCLVGIVLPLTAVVGVIVLIEAAGYRLSDAAWDLAFRFWLLLQGVVGMSAFLRLRNALRRRRFLFR